MTGSDGRARSTTRSDRGAQGGARVSSEDGFGLIEVLIALIVLAVGLLGVAGLALVASEHTTAASVRTEQEIAAQMVLEGLLRQGYDGLDDEVASGASDTTVHVKGRQLTVTKSVAQVDARVRRLVARVGAIQTADSIVRSTRVAEP